MIAFYCKDISKINIVGYRINFNGRKQGRIDSKFLE